MATRFYLGTLAVSGAITPAVDAGWESSAAPFARQGIDKNTAGGDTLTTTAGFTSTAGQDRCHRQFISAPLAAGNSFNSATSFKCYVQVLESAANDNIRSRLGVRVLSRDGSVVQSTLLAIAEYGDNLEWNIALRNKGFANGDFSAGTYTTVQGDRLVVEIGHNDSAGSSISASSRWGRAGSADLGENETSTSTTERPWFETSLNLLFEGETIGLARGTSDNTMTLLHFEGADGATTFTDSSGKGHTWTANGNVQIDTAQSKFGTSSCLFDGTGDFLSGDGSGDFGLGIEPFAIDFQYRPDTLALDQPLVDFRTTTTPDNFEILVQSNGAINLFQNGTRISSAAGTIVVDTWHHVALTRDASGNHRLFVGGTQAGSTYSPAVNLNYQIPPAGPLIGVAFDAQAGASILGWIDEFRIVRGDAVWTSNFTAPTEPHGKITGVGASLTTAVGSAAGASTPTGLSSSLVTTRGTAAGSSTVTGVAEVVASAATGSAAGTSTVTGTASSLVQASGTAAGTSAVAGTATSLAQTSGTAAGTSTVTAASSALQTGVGSAAGTSTVSGVGAAVGAAAGSATGTSTVSGVGQTLVVVTGSAAGASTVSGVSQAQASDTAGSASGTSTVAAVGASTTNTAGSTAGTSTVTGIADQGAAAGSAAGTSTVSGFGVAITAVAGNAAGASAVSGTTTSLTQTAGNAAGASAVNGTTTSLAQTAGSAAGTSSVSGVGAAVDTGIGSAAGTSIVSGIGAAVGAATGSAAGTSTVIGADASIAATVGNAAGTSTASGFSEAAVAAGTAIGTSTVEGRTTVLTFAVGNAAGSSVVSAVGEDATPAAGGAARFNAYMIVNPGTLKRAA